jgi:hypothetical protein
MDYHDDHLNAPHTQLFDQVVREASKTIYEVKCLPSFHLFCPSLLLGVPSIFLMTLMMVLASFLTSFSLRKDMIVR